MKTIFNILLCVCFCMNGFSQKSNKHTQEKYTSFKGDLSLNARLGKYFAENIKWDNYDTLCLIKVLFVKFTAGNKKVSTIKCSDDELPFLNSTIEKALLSTAEFWQGKSNEVYLLPFYASFEDHCHPKINAGNLFEMLQIFSGEQTVNTIPGYKDYTPLTCTILNSFYIKSHWE